MYCATLGPPTNSKKKTDKTDKLASKLPSPNHCESRDFLLVF